MPKIDEAMALAGMNPMVGMSGPHHASFIVNVMNHDKDLGDDGKILTGVSKSLDMDDNLYGIDQNGRFFAKRKYDVMERKDIIECYKVNVDCTALIESIEKEIQIPYDMRPVHKPSYIYESLTGHTLLDENQMEYDTLCEKVQLDKMTAALAGVTQGSLQRAHNMQTGKQDKEAGYIPDNDFPQGTENMSVPGMALESKELGDSKYTDCCKAFVDNFNELFPKYAARHLKRGGVYNTDKGYPYIVRMQVQGIKSPKRVLDGYEYMLKSIYDKLIEQGYSVIYDGADNGGRSIKYETKEVAAEEYEPDTQDLQYIREVANTKFYVEGETMYGLDESYKDSLKVYKSLSPSEQLLVSPNGRFINSPNLLFRYNHKINQVPVGFAEVYKYNDRDDAGFIIVAISPEARGQKIADILVQKSISGCKSKHIKKLIWRCDISNQASMRIAERNGFILDKIGKSCKVYHKDLLQEEFKPSVSLEEGLFRSMGIVNESKPDSNTTIPFKTVEESNEQPVDESVFNAISLKGGPHLTLYHGSPDKHKQILPTSFSVGNRMHDPSWSVFMFDDKRLAMAYAIGYTIGVKHGNWIKGEKLSPPIGWIEKDGLLKYKPVNIVDEKDWDKIKNHIIGTKFYVYTLEVPIDKDLNIVGTAVSLPEYTYTGVPKVVKCEEFTMTKEILDMQYKPLPTAEYQKWKAKKMGKMSVYGPWIKYFVNMSTRGTKRKLVLKTLKLEPGSDLSFINDIIGPDDVHNYVGKWLEDKFKILYIVGLAGSGKTTMSNKLGKLLDVKVIHVDEVHHAISKANGGGDKWRAKCNAQERRDMLWKEVMKRAGNDKCIIEGGPMILYKVSELEKQPFIIPGTSTITSTYRMIKRTLSNDPKQGLPAFLSDYKNKSKFEMVSKMLKIISSCAIGNLKIGSQLDELKSKVTLEDGMMSLLGVKK